MRASGEGAPANGPQPAGDGHGLWNSTLPGAEPFTGQVRQMRHGRVLIDHLENEEMQCRVGIELAFSPREFQLVANPHCFDLSFRT